MTGVYALWPKSMGIGKSLYIILRYKVASFVRGCLWFCVVRHLLRINDLQAKLHFSCKKVFRIFGWYAVKQYFCTRFQERNADEYWNTETKLRSRTSTEKTFLKISSEKFWWFGKSPYLCIRFWKESHKEEFFERFRYEQASSTRLVNEEWIMKN